MIVGPKILGRATDVLAEGILSKITGFGTGIDFEKIGQILLSLVILYFVSALFSYVGAG